MLEGRIRAPCDQRLRTAESTERQKRSQLAISLANPVQEVQPLAHLAGHALDNANRDTMVVVTLDHGQQVAAQHLEHHAHVAAVRTDVVEAVHQLHGTAVRIQTGPVRTKSACWDG